MKKLISILISLVFFSCSLLQAEEKTNLQLQDQLKLVQKIEFGKLDTGIGETFQVPFNFPFRNCRAIGSLVIEVDDLKLDTCLKAVQARIKAGYDPNYPGDFDNSFLNELMIGVLNQHEDHARRKIAFKLRNPVNDPDISLPVEVLQTRNVMICDVGLSKNHRYVGLNFWQEFVGNRELSDVAACFFLLDHKGNILWRQQTQEISDPNWEDYKQKMRISQMTDRDKSNDGRMRGIFWYPGAVRDKEPVQSFIISNEGHVLTYNGIFGLWLDMGRGEGAPRTMQLCNRHGTINYSTECCAANFRNPIFTSDGSKLLLQNHYEDGKVMCVDSTTGDVLPETDLCSSKESKEANYSLQTKQSVIKHEPEQILVSWVVSIFDQSGEKVAETKNPLSVQVQKEFKFYRPFAKEQYFNAKTVIDTKAVRFYVVSPVGFLKFQFAPLARSKGNGS